MLNKALLAGLFTSLLLFVSGCSGSTSSYTPLDVIDKMKASVGCADEGTLSSGFTDVIKEDGTYSDGGTTVVCDTKGEGKYYISVYDSVEDAEKNFARMCEDYEVVDQDPTEDKILWGANWAAYKSYGPVLIEEVQDALGGDISTIEEYCNS